MPKPNVLIVDDDRELVRALQLRFLKLGLPVRVAHDAITALQKVQEYAPDLVVLDVTMPSGNGLSVCEMLAGDPGSAMIPVIILTGRKDERTLQRCQEMLAYYVFKSTDVWSQLEPLVFDLLHLDEVPQATEESLQA